MRPEKSTDMGKTLSITVYPALVHGEYLTVSDAMKQVLDIVEGLERSEADHRIVWRLTEAHTNSPPFTVVTSPYPADPAVSVSLEAPRVIESFADGVRSLLRGDAPEWFDPDVGKPLRRVLERNLNGIGRTAVEIDGELALDIDSQRARTAIVALDRIRLEEEATKRDWTRTEYGTAEGQIAGLARWNDKPSLIVKERLSEQVFKCVLSQELVERIGPAHKWIEAWDGSRVFVTGALHYNADSVLKRADIDDLEVFDWTDVSIRELRKVDLVDGKTVEEHIRLIRGQDFG